MRGKISFKKELPKPPPDWLVSEGLYLKVGGEKMQGDKKEMIGVLTAMSIVSKRLAKQLQELEEESKYDENDNECEENAKSNVATGRG